MPRLSGSPCHGPSSRSSAWPSIPRWPCSRPGSARLEGRPAGEALPLHRSAVGDRRVPVAADSSRSPGRSACRAIPSCSPWRSGSSPCPRCVPGDRLAHRGRLLRVILDPRRDRRRSGHAGRRDRLGILGICKILQRLDVADVYGLPWTMGAGDSRPSRWSPRRSSSSPRVRIRSVQRSRSCSSAPLRLELNRERPVDRPGRRDALLFPGAHDLRPLARDRWEIHHGLRIRTPPDRRRAGFPGRGRAPPPAFAVHTGSRQRHRSSSASRPFVRPRSS